MTLVCGVQMAPARGDAAGNTGLAVAELEAAAREGAALVAFPEAALTGYVFDAYEEALAAAVSADGPELAGIAEACRREDVWCVIGAIEREGERLFNSAFVIGPGGVAGRYRKVHTLCLGVDRFTHASEEGFRVFDLPFGRVGVHICYDGTFPEGPRTLRVLGAQLLLLPTNWPDLRLRRELVQIRAHENHAYFFAVNRVGTEGGVRFEGGSSAADPMGELLLCADDGPGRFYVEMDLASADDTRIVVRRGAYEFDRVVDRRPEAYRPLVEAPVTGTRTGSRKARG